VPEFADTLAQEVLALCRAEGFALAGVSDAAPSGRGRELAEWLGAGKHGSMAYLAEHLDVRLNPARLLDGARSIVMVADLYSARGQSTDPPLPPRHGRLARYARGRDYHMVIKKRLHSLADALRARFPGAGFRAFVDTAPVLEREYAARAGMGWIGKHTLLIHPRIGSYTLLGGVATTLELAAPPPPGQLPVADHCGTCTRCIDACPTEAISPYSVDATRCISYLTIERRGPIAPELHAGIGEWMYGCDVCQEVCPHNSVRPEGAELGTIREEYTPRRGSLDVLEVLGWTAASRSAAFSGSAMKRATLEMMKRNALIVAGNLLRRGEDPALRARIEAMAQDPAECEMVRETARAILWSSV
jgi:epoxyqueuosine reductase